MLARDDSRAAPRRSVPCGRRARSVRRRHAGHPPVAGRRPPLAARLHRLPRHQPVVCEPGGTPHREGRHLEGNRDVLGPAGRLRGDVQLPHHLRRASRDRTRLQRRRGQGGRTRRRGIARPRLLGARARSGPVDRRANRAAERPAVRRHRHRARRIHPHFRPGASGLLRAGDDGARAGRRARRRAAHRSRAAAVHGKGAAEARRVDRGRERRGHRDLPAPGGGSSRLESSGRGHRPQRAVEPCRR